MAFITRILTRRGLFHKLRYDSARTLSMTWPLASENKTTNSSNESKQSNGHHNSSSSSSPQTDKKKPLDDIDYIVSFKTFDVKKAFKQFYSVYGPLFVACHIGVSLVSLGFFCSVTWSVVDPMQLVPDILSKQVGHHIMNSAEHGTKFLVAYAMHKVILPIRFTAAVWATRRLATRVDFFRNRIEKAKK